MLREILLDRLLSWQRGISAPPFKIELNPTHLCNLRCPFCGQREFDAEGRNQTEEIPTPRYVEIIREGAKIGVRGWRLQGAGEPMCRPEKTMAIVREIKKSGMEVEITTNGTLFDRETIDELVELEVDELQFSLDGSCPATQDAMRGKAGTFDRIMEALEAFREQKETLGLQKPRIVLHTVLATINFMDLPGIAALGAKVGCDRLSLNTVHAHNETGEGLKVVPGDHEDLTRSITAAVETASKHAIPNNYEDFLDRELSEKSNTMREVILTRADNGRAEGLLAAPCLEPWYSMTVSVEGRVGACCVHQDPSTSLVEVSLREAWEGTSMTGLRELMLAGSLPGFCTICSGNIFNSTQRLKAELLDHMKANFIVPERD
ncbi:radical SAM protein [Thermodesulfobacteriota bacterium]